MGPKTMSETRDSFKEIEYSDLDSLSESSTVNQHSTSVNSASRMTTSTDQVKTLQLKELKELEFEMLWETRDEITFILNQHTKLLSGLIIKADAKKKMQKANFDLIATLMNLPSKTGGRSKSLQSAGCSADEGLNELLLDLNWRIRSKIFDTLVANHHVLLEADSVASECKTKLIDQNNDLAFELLKLRSRIVFKGYFSVEIFLK